MQRIMVADDSGLMRRIIREIVEPEDYRVVAEARDGREALRGFLLLRPDVVLLDLVMPRLSGIGALREIRRVDPGACVVMCSGFGQDSLAAEALTWGARDIVWKPFRPLELLEALQRATRPLAFAV